MVPKTETARDLLALSRPAPIAYSRISDQKHSLKNKKIHSFCTQYKKKLLKIFSHPLNKSLVRKAGTEE